MSEADDPAFFKGRRWIRFHNGVRLSVVTDQPAPPTVEVGCCEVECDVSLLMGFCPRRDAMMTDHLSR